MSHPLQSVGSGKQQIVSLGDSAEGTITKPIGLVEATPMEVSFTERFTSQTIELLGRLHRRPIRVLLDSGSIGNYICCAPIERYGTAQYIGQRRETEQSPNEIITCTLIGSHI